MATSDDELDPGAVFSLATFSSLEKRPAFPFDN
jgi:hypothetical protein